MEYRIKIFENGDVKAAILAGGLGTRLAEVTDRIPKPMVEVGGKPLLWHIMKGFAAGGVRDFILALGYKGEVIKEYFREPREGWAVELLDTLQETQTGGRVRRVLRHIGKEAVLLTYGDGVADIDVSALRAFHARHGKAATVTAVRPPARFGALSLSGDRVSSFEEKPQMGEGWINGGFFILEPTVADYIDGDASVFEREPLERLAEDGQLMAFRHERFWHCVDTLRDLRLLEGLWDAGSAPWKTW